jgi:hypothetical protein
LSPDIIAANLQHHWAASARTGRRSRGRQWYPAARAWAAALAAETGHTLEQVVAVLAITSPGAQLVSNVKWTEAILRGETETGGRFPNANRLKIAGVLASPDAAAEYVRGPKVGPFHHAILGATDALVLDRWALYAATGERIEQLSRKGARELVENAYRELARRVGITVRDLQAVIWLQVRETTEHAKSGTVHQLQDFTLGLAA